MTLEAPPPLPQLIDGPADAPATLLFAHGAGAPMDSPFMAAIAGGLAAKGWRVVRFEFSYMARMRETGRRQGPDRLPLLQEAFREQVRVERASWPQRPLFIFKPTKSSGLSEAHNWATAVAFGDQFIRQLISN